MMCVDNRLADRQAYAKTIRLGRIEGLEELINHIGRYAYTAVTNAQPNRTVVLPASADSEYSGLIGD